MTLGNYTPLDKRSGPRWPFFSQTDERTGICLDGGKWRSDSDVSNQKVAVCGLKLKKVLPLLGKAQRKLPDWSIGKYPISLSNNGMNWILKSQAIRMDKAAFLRKLIGPMPEETATDWGPAMLFFAELSLF
ncbi:hypothetical protein NPIL_359001 [Nephila pilipes]|uniref:Uncharacterized protein n=1 Tax=Nephila pilipes TaxID=299642 RepID=A0A8X6TG60_NEPPI|nr:hypothetical protein NPIL_359001 [Nephila pilipes]